MRLEVSKVAEDASWDAQAGSLGGTICHSSIWARYNAAAFPNALPQFMTLLDEHGQIVGLALGFHEQSRHRWLASLTGRLWLDALPAVGSGGEERLLAFLGLLEDYARRGGVTELSIDSYACRGGKEVFEKLGFTVIRRLEFELSLEASEESLWNGMEYKRRKNIKKAQRLGVVIRELPVEEGVLELRRLQAESGQRILRRGGPHITYTGNPDADPVKVLVASGYGRIIGAEVDGKIASAGLFTCVRGLVYHMLSGHAEAALRSQASTLLLWETIKQYRREGAKRFNLGGCKMDAMNESSPEHGVYAYKRDFGGACIDCASGQKVLRKAARRIVSIAKAAIGRWA